MKLIMENWRKHLNEDVPNNKTVIAYHSSNKRFSKFSMEMADSESHSGVGLFFMEDPNLVRPFKYIYKVELNLRDGVRYGSQAREGDNVNFEYDYAWSRTPEDEKLVYKMLNDKDIKILDVRKR